MSTDRMTAAEPLQEARPGAALLSVVLGAAAGIGGSLLPLPGAIPLALLALALHGAAAALALGHAPEGSLPRTLLRRLPLAVLLLLATAALPVALLAAPLYWLLQSAGLLPVLLLSAAAALAWLALWRIWPLALLGGIDRPRRRGARLWPGECWQSARQLVDADPSFPRGLLAGLLWLLLLAGSAASASVELADPRWQWGLLLAWWLLLAPAAARRPHRTPAGGGADRPHRRGHRRPRCRWQSTHPAGARRTRPAHPRHVGRGAAGYPPAAPADRRRCRR
jgi:hypothetical protein